MMSPKQFNRLLANTFEGTRWEWSLSVWSGLSLAETCVRNSKEYTKLWRILHGQLYLDEVIFNRIYKLINRRDPSRYDSALLTYLMLLVDANSILAPKAARHLYKTKDKLHWAKFACLKLIYEEHYPMI